MLTITIVIFHTWNYTATSDSRGLGFSRAMRFVEFSKYFTSWKNNSELITGSFTISMVEALIYVALSKAQKTFAL
jgi:hypothetical protein